MSRKWIITLTGIALGALGGWLYYEHVGCANGTCAITSNPWASTLYGALMGSLLAGFFTPASRAEQNNTTTNEQRS